MGREPPYRKSNANSRPTVLFNLRLRGGLFAKLEELKKKETFAAYIEPT